MTVISKNIYYICTEKLSINLHYEFDDKSEDGLMRNSKDILWHRISEPVVMQSLNRVHNALRNEFNR